MSSLRRSCIFELGCDPMLHFCNQWCFKRWKMTWIYVTWNKLCLHATGLSTYLFSPTHQFGYDNIINVSCHSYSSYPPKKTTYFFFPSSLVGIIIVIRSLSLFSCRLKNQCWVVLFIFMKTIGFQFFSTLEKIDSIFEILILMRIN